MMSSCERIVEEHVCGKPEIYLLTVIEQTEAIINYKNLEKSDDVRRNAYKEFTKLMFGCVTRENFTSVVKCAGDGIQSLWA